MSNKPVIWLSLTLAGLALGGVFGFILTWIWFFIGVFFFGFGDSGPAWVNTVNDAILFVGVIIGVVGGQLIFFRKIRIQSASPASAPPR